MHKAYVYLIIVWSLVCASGLAVFLFQVYGPSADIAGDTGGPVMSSAIAVGFWVLLWAVPVVILTFVRRRREQ